MKSTFPPEGKNDQLNYIEIKTISSPKHTSKSEKGERLCVCMYMSVLTLNVSRALRNQ